VRHYTFSPEDLALSVNADAPPPLDLLFSSHTFAIQADHARRRKAAGKHAGIVGQIDASQRDFMIMPAVLQTRREHIAELQTCLNADSHAAAMRALSFDSAE